MADVTMTFDASWLFYSYIEDTCHDFDLSNEWGDVMSAMGGLTSLVMCQPVERENRGEGTWLKKYRTGTFLSWYSLYSL